MKIGYIRSSFLETSTEVQISNLKEYGCAHIYEEDAKYESLKRPVLKRIVEDLAPGDTLIIYKLGVLGQNVSDLLNLLDFFASSEIALVSLMDRIDTKSEDGKLICHGLRCLSQFERSLHRERTTSGIRLARLKGKTVGKSKGLSAIAELQAQKAESLFRQGYSVTKISSELCVSRQTAYNYLRYRGIQSKSTVI